MTEWPIGAGGQVWEDGGADETDSGGTAVASPGSSHTKGSWTELIASTAHDAAGILVSIGPVASGRSYSVDIGIGAAGSEVVIVPDLIRDVQAGGADFTCVDYYLPIFVPAGSRLSARQQSTNAFSAEIDTVVYLMSAGFGPDSTYHRVEVAGFDDTTTLPTSVDPGGTANTKGSWVELSSATTFDWSQILFAAGSLGNTAFGVANWLVDLAVGSAGSEQIVLPNMHFAVDTSSDWIVPDSLGPLPIQIPAGSRVAVRAQSSQDDATDRLIGLCVYGIG